MDENFVHHHYQNIQTAHTKNKNLGISLIETLIVDIYGEEHIRPSNFNDSRCCWLEPKFRQNMIHLYTQCGV